MIGKAMLNGCEITILAFLGTDYGIVRMVYVERLDGKVKYDLLNDENVLRMVDHWPSDLTNNKSPKEIKKGGRNG